jgi:hypothetical protein
VIQPVQRFFYHVHSIHEADVTSRINHMLLFIQDHNKTTTRPQLLLNTAALDRLGAPEIYLRPEKRGFKIPINSDRVDDERGDAACPHAMVSICSIPNDLSGDNKLERLWRIASTERGVACVA